MLVATAGLCVPAASASRFLQHGIFDDAQILYGNPDKTFPMLATLKTMLPLLRLLPVVTAALAVVVEDVAEALLEGVANNQ